MLKKIVLLLTAAPFFLQAQVMWQIKKDTVIKWYYYDGDEFSDSSYDKLKWTPAFSWSEVNYDMKYKMTPERMVFENGICHFMCFRDTGYHTIPGWTLDSSFRKKYNSDMEGDKFKYYFTSGNVWSKKKYGHGYFELRFKATGVFGMWPTFWMFGEQKDEIDFFELKGERENQIHVDIHCVRGCDRKYKPGGIFNPSFGGWIKCTQALHNGYNVLAGEWQDGYVRWYLNGEGIASFKGNLDSKTMSLIMGTGPAQDGKAFSPGVRNDSEFPNSFDVDYVRVWYKTAESRTDVAGKQHSTFNYFPDTAYKKARLKKKINFMYDKKAFKKDIMTISVLPKVGKKLIVSSLGPEVNYNLKCYNMNNKEIMTKTIQSDMTEIDLTGLISDDVVKIVFDIGGRQITEKLTLVK